MTSSEVDLAGLGRRVLSLLRLGPGAEVEISLLRSGQVLLSKTEKKEGKIEP
jgi:hypothetical protein